MYTFTLVDSFVQICLHTVFCISSDSVTRLWMWSNTSCHSSELGSTCCRQHLNTTMCFTDPTKLSELNVGVAFVGFSHLGPACLARRFPELRDCPDEPTMEPADIVATCGFSIWKRKNGCLTNSRTQLGGIYWPQALIYWKWLIIFSHHDPCVHHIVWCCWTGPEPTLDTQTVCWLLYIHFFLWGHGCYDNRVKVSPTFCGDVNVAFCAVKKEVLLF